MLRIESLGVAFAVLAFPAVAIATTYTVHADGTGDFPTIQAAVDVAMDGDIIELTDGFFAGSGNRDVLVDGRALTIRSLSRDPALCTIDCGGSSASPHTAFKVLDVDAPGLRLEGFTIRNAWAGFAPYVGIDCRRSVLNLENLWLLENTGRVVSGYQQSVISAASCRFELNDGGGIAGDGGTSMVVSGCTFRNNGGTSYGAAIIIGGGGGVIEDCTFEGHDANWGAAVYYGGRATVRVERCSFVGNDSQLTGALCFHSTFGASVLVRDCVFTGNPTTAVYCLAYSSPRFEECTFDDNDRAIVANSDCNPVLERCIITNSAREAAYCRTASSVTLSCCDVYGNVGGDWTGCLDGQGETAGNFSADPGFCDPDDGNVSLNDRSPCLPGNHPDGVDCGLIGAVGVGCVTTPVDETSWGRVKSRFQ